MVSAQNDTEKCNRQALVSYSSSILKFIVGLIQDLESNHTPDLLNQMV